MPFKSGDIMYFAKKLLKNLHICNFCCIFAANYAIMHKWRNANKHKLTNLYVYEERFIS